MEGNGHLSGFIHNRDVVKSSARDTKGKGTFVEINFAFLSLATGVCKPVPKPLTEQHELGLAGRVAWGNPLPCKVAGQLVSCQSPLIP